MNQFIKASSVEGDFVAYVEKKVYSFGRVVHTRTFPFAYYTSSSYDRGGILLFVTGREAQGEGDERHLGEY